MALKNRGQLPGVESKNSSSGGGGERKTKKKTTIGRSMSCAVKSICGTKESAVLSRGSRRSSGRSAASSSRSLKAPGSGAGGDAFSSVSVSVSASSSFNSETTVATTATTVSYSSSSSSSSSAASALSSPLSSVKAATGSGSFRKKKLPGGSYYECHSEAAALDPSAAAAAMAMMLPCAGCDEFFLSAESLELHKSTSHAVSELGAGDTSRSVVEIIFRSSWKKKPPSPSCCIERILKVRSSGNGAAARLEFEQYRARVMESAAASGDATRCAADGNELLRFFRSTTASHCSLGLANGGAALCSGAPSSQCELCGIIRDGFSIDGDGRIATAATSRLAHDMAAGGGGGEKRAMLVCRVVAGRVKKKKKSGNGGGNGGGSSDSSEEFDYDSVSSSSTSCSSELDELFVFNPSAILPCFVVIYTVAN